MTPLIPEDKIEALAKELRLQIIIGADMDIARYILDREAKQWENHKEVVELLTKENSKLSRNLEAYNRTVAMRPFNFLNVEGGTKINMPEPQSLASILDEISDLKSKLAIAENALKNVERTVFCGTQLDHKFCGRCIAIKALTQISEARK